jgi:hypothetical protein
MPPAFRAAILRFGQGNLPPTRYQIAGLLSQAFSHSTTIRTLRRLALDARMAGQFLDANLASH